MAVEIEELAVAISARTQKFERGMKRSGKVLDGFKRRIGRLKIGLLSLGASLVGLVAGGAFARMINSVSGSADAVTKFADSIGASVEQITGLQHAADLAGVGAESFQKGLKDMVRRIGEAATGTGEAVDALNDLGLSAERLKKLRPEDQFKRIADAFGTIKNTTDQTRIAFDLFGRSGVGFLNLLRQGSRAINSQIREAKDLGITITATQGKAFERFEDAKTRFSSLLSGLKIQLAAAFVDPLTDATDRLRAFFTELSDRRGGIRGLAQDIAITLLEVFQTITVQMTKLFSGIAKIVSFLTPGQIGGFDSQGVQDFFDRAINEIKNAAVRAQGLETFNATRNLGPLNKGESGVIQELGRQGKKADKTNSLLERLVELSASGPSEAFPQARFAR